MNPVFFQYKPENVLDQLIALFNKQGWNLSETKVNYFHKFRWPDIVLSDKIARLPEPLDRTKDNYPHTIELLGCYQTTCNPLEEGRVVLYVPTIRKTALEYATAMKITDAEEINQCIERLTAVILIHEFAHWAVHVGHSPKPASPDCFIKTLPGIEYYDEDSIRYHETCAQIFTNYICSINEEIWPLFLWLSEKQPEQYNKYHELFGKDIASKKKITDEQLTSFIYCLEITRAYNIQNYRFFKLHLNKKTTDLSKAIKNIKDTNDLHSDIIDCIDKIYTDISSPFWDDQKKLLIHLSKLLKNNYLNRNLEGNAKENTIADEKDTIIRGKIGEVIKDKHPDLLIKLEKIYKGAIGGKNFGL
jgi:hypothetical protein